MCDIVYKVINPDNEGSDESGPIIDMIKIFERKLIPKGEHVFREGEIATEMYFIIEGKA